MGSIKKEVQDHLWVYTSENKILIPFTEDFSVTWARRLEKSGTALSAFLLKPDKFIIDNYGIKNEILMVYSSYGQLFPKTLQIIDELCNSPDIRQRIDKMSVVLVCRAENAKNWVLSNQLPEDHKTIITFHEDDLKGKNDPWIIRNRFNEFLYAKDYFDFRLPLKDHDTFFGRTDEIGSFLSCIQKNENRGLFGLRKTGKTSILMNVIKKIEANESYIPVFIDCKRPDIRNKQWYELLNYICINIKQVVDVTAPSINPEKKALSNFQKLLDNLKKKHPTKKIILVFDEIEFISFHTPYADHWVAQYTDFWQSIWALQSDYKNLMFIICGVNAKLLETPELDIIQNPLFGIVSHQYLTGLDSSEIKEMILTLGPRMGLDFDEDAINYLIDNYGGHPYLTRLACSFLNKIIANNPLFGKPYKIDRTFIESNNDLLISELIFYAGHVVLEIKKFYPDEYNMLEMLAEGQNYEFLKLSRFSEFTKHLLSYGIVKYVNHRPVFNIPIIQEYLTMELRRNRGQNLCIKAIPNEEREQFVKQRIDNICEDIKLLERYIKRDTTKPLLFGFNSFPNGENLAKIVAVKNNMELSTFLNYMNMSFVESIEVYGRHMGDTNYFWGSIKSSYPELFKILEKIKNLRHNEFHLRLKSDVDTKVVKIIEQYLDGAWISEVEDYQFILQQRILDEFIFSLQLEIGNYS